MSYCVVCSVCNAKSPQVESTAEVPAHGWAILSSSTVTNPIVTTTFLCPTHKGTK